MLFTARYPAALPVLRSAGALLAAAALLSACSPALDWRDVRPKDVNILLTYPCKPEQIAQDVVLADQTVKMSMTGCVADKMTFALAHARLPSPALAARALAQLHLAAVDNVHGRVTASTTAAPKNATPNLPDNALGFVYLPAFLIMAVVATLFTPLGVKLASHINERVLRRVFAVFLLVAAAVILMS